MGGAKVNATCVFPFKFRGVSYRECIFETSPNDPAWCSTLVDDDSGKHVGGQGNWGECGEECPIQGGTEHTVIIIFST